MTTASGAGPARRDPFESLLAALNSIGTAWIFVLMLVILADVVGRTAFSAPVPGVPELVSLSIVGIVFLQIAHTVRSGRITRIATFSNWLQRRSPRAASALQAVYDACGAALFVLLLGSLWPIFVRSWVRNEYVGVEGYVAYPVWPVNLILIIGCACSALQFALLAWRNLETAFGRSSFR